MHWTTTIKLTRTINLWFCEIGLAVLPANTETSKFECQSYILIYTRWHANTTLEFKSTLTRRCSLQWGILKLQGTYSNNLSNEIPSICDAIKLELASVGCFFVEPRCVHTQVLYGQSNKRGLRFSFPCFSFYTFSYTPGVGPFRPVSWAASLFCVGKILAIRVDQHLTQTRPIHRCCMSFFSNEVHQSNSLYTVALQCETKTNSLDMLTRRTHKATGSCSCQCRIAYLGRIIERNFTSSSTLHMLYQVSLPGDKYISNPNMLIIVKDCIVWN